MNTETARHNLSELSNDDLHRLRFRMVDLVEEAEGDTTQPGIRIAVELVDAIDREKERRGIR